MATLAAKGVGVGDTILFSIWNFWNSLSKSMSLLGVAAVDDGKNVGSCLVYWMEGLGVTAT